MAALDSGDVKVYCRGVDLSTWLQLTTLEQMMEEIDATAYADAVRIMVPSFQRVSLAHAGIYADGSFSLAEAFRAAGVTDSEPITIAPTGAVVGNPAFIVISHRASITMPEAASPGGVHKASLRASSHYAMADGVIAHSGAVSADTQTAAYNLGAVIAGQQVTATVHLIGIAPTPSVVFFLESDDAGAFTTPTTQATSAAQTARGSVLLQSTGVVTDTWWRVRWDHSGTGSFTAVIAIGIAK